MSLVAQSSSEETRLLILVIGLVIIAVMLSALTVWYWRYTDPKRYLKSPRKEKSQQPVRNPTARPRQDQRYSQPIDLNAETPNSNQRNINRASASMNRNLR